MDSSVGFLDLKADIKLIHCRFSLVALFRSVGALMQKSEHKATCWSTGFSSVGFLDLKADIKLILE